MKNKVIIRAVHFGLMAVVLGLTLSCSKQSADPTAALPDTVSFQHDILPLFSANCSLSGCHASPSPKGNLDLSASVAYSQLWKRQLVDTLHPDASVLYIQINSVSNPMPPTGRLPDRTIALVLKWIQQKAPDN